VKHIGYADKPMFEGGKVGIEQFRYTSKNVYVSLDFPIDILVLVLDETTVFWRFERVVAFRKVVHVQKFGY
jgi:hypothetical protein